jgi:hypothetical protein
VEAGTTRIWAGGVFRRPPERDARSIAQSSAPLQIQERSQRRRSEKQKQATATNSKATSEASANNSETYTRKSAASVRVPFGA